MSLSRLTTLACVLALVPVAPAASDPGKIGSLTTNGRTQPLGVSADDLSFGWSSTSEARGAVQTAYHVRVGTTEQGDDVWDSGRVASDRQTDIALPASVRLSPATRYHWQVRTWDGGGVASEWSASAWFETGLLSAADWAGAEWITRPASFPGPGDWTDYTATIDFTLHDLAFGVLLRASSDAADGYMFQINVGGPTPRLVCHKKIKGAYSIFASVELDAFGFGTETLRQGRHTLEFEVEGARITTRLDDREIDTRTDATFPSGLVGVRTHGRERATVSAVKVIRKTDGLVLLATDFSSGENPFTGGKVADGACTISGDTEAVYARPDSPRPLLRDVINLKKPVRSARVYASAHGVYQLSLNGGKVGDQFLAPGWTDYDKRIQSQTYDVTALLRPGANAIGAALADGWYRGKVGLGWTRVYGDTLALIVRLKVVYADGATEWFDTGPRWTCADGPWLRADLQDGEIYDARRESVAWDTPGFDASGWTPVGVVAAGSAQLVPQPDEPIRAIQILTAAKRTTPAPGEHVYDLGQNMVGVARIRMSGQAGQTVRIRHAEELYRRGDRIGRLYTANFRTAKVTDTYTFARDGVVTYQPTFTQHGFRYIEITGLDSPPESHDVQGVVLGSDLPDTGDLETSNPLLNQLVRNIRWGQRGNFVSIPTDTPARDERLGWTGDISVFAPTASFFQDTRAFLSKWMDDVRDVQRADGNIPAVVPQPRREFDQTGVGWSDAFVTVPYAVWQATGDTRIVRRNWDAMQRFYRFVHESATHDGDLLEQGRSSWFSGDWLNLEGVDRLQEHRLIATAYFAENTRMMSELATALGEPAKAAEWAALVPRIRQAFVDAYCRPDGSLHIGTQTVYAMALGMDLIADPAQRERTARKFVEKLAADDHHLRTGFLGTPWLLPALSRIGRDDLAFRLLLNEDYPSWGFEIRMGATTMWERWNTIRADGEFGPVDMNSFNHYAYGAVADWMFRHIGGLQPIGPGYKKARIAPLIGQGGLTHAKSALRTPYGRLGCEWRREGPSWVLLVEIPANTTAEVVIPASAAEAVLGDDGRPAISGEGAGSHVFQNDRLVLTLGAGRHRFTSPAE